MTFVLILLLGVLVGFIAGFFGIGGGGVLVPILMLFGYSIKEAVGISVMQMVFSSLFGSYLNYKKGLLNVKNGIFVGLGGASGALLSGLIVSFTPEIVLIFTFTCTLLFAIYRFFQTSIQTDEKEKGSPILFYLIGLFIGAIAISLGIGGGMFIAPILVGFLHVDIKKAVSMGLFFVVFSSISGFISLSLNSLVNYQMGLILGLGSLLGAYFGTKLSHSIEKGLQKKLLLGLYITMFLVTLSKLIEKM